MKLGEQHNFRVVARSGGHSYIANGLGGKNGSFVVDMSNFNTVTVDPTTNIAQIGPGNTLGNVALALNSYGRAIPHGTCPYVGIGGHSGKIQVFRYNVADNEVQGMAAMGLPPGNGD